MVSSFTANKRIEQPAFNDYIDSWDVPVNADWGIIDTALGGVYTLNATGLTGNQVLTATQYQPLKIRVTGLPIGAINVRIPTAVGGIWVVRNDTTGGFTITIDSAAGGAAVTIPVGQNTIVTCDGTSLGMFIAINTPGAAAGSNTQLQFNNSGVLGGSADLTWNGTLLSTTGLTTTGPVILGDAAGDTLAINGTAVAAANGLAINTNQLFLNSAGTKVAVGTITPGASMFTVAGTIESTSGGFVFPDGSVQTSSASSPTGSVTAFIGSTAPTGWILAWGTIGGPLSSATNRANADCANLFALFWNSWANGQAAVSGGRGANAAVDFAASKTIAICDMRGRAPIGRDNMGGSTASRVTSTTMTPDGNTLGATGGEQTHTLIIGEMPQHFHSVSISTAGVGGTGGGSLTQIGGGSDTTNAGSSLPHNNMIPGVMMNYIIKL